jgi:apolipoprotein N-acyltransferase
VRNIVRSTKDPETGDSVDFLLNLTNDGWFHGSSELDQHLITSVFRAVECRTPLLRAVNTGISAFIDGDGVVLEPEQFIDGDNQGRETMIDPATGRWRKQLHAALVHTVPVDDRDSLYVWAGDWFAMACGIMALLSVVVGYAPQSRKYRNVVSDSDRTGPVQSDVTSHD